jgi:AbrB family looped-hinge helix DNA binding protein
VPIFNLKIKMSTLLVSSKGQILLPAEMRRRLGMRPGSRIEVIEESDGLKLRVVRAVTMRQHAGVASHRTEGLGHQRVKSALRRHDDLDALAGSWSQAESDAIERDTAPFDKVDPELWK